jgi:Ca2+-binding EF-hand superfamily protein|tara:strand:+ start:110 stop:451 length:342 start_codon:yes stop_codon:yes gene_type:complete
MHTAPPCQLPLAPVPRLFQESNQGGNQSPTEQQPPQQQMEEDEIIMLSIQKAFQNYDPDGIGSIGIESLDLLINDLQEGMAPSEIRDMKINLDITNTGRVGFHVFHAFWVGSN